MTATITFGGNALPAGTWVLGFSGLPAGVTTVPAAPSYTILPAILGISATVTFQFSVGAGAVPGGPFIITVSDPATLTSKDFALTVLAPPDFALRLNPVSLSLPAGGSGITQVTVQPLSGFNGVVQVTAPTIPGITFSPANFSVVAGGTQPVTVAAAPGTLPNSYTGNFTGTAVGIPGTRTAGISVTVTPAPDFSLSAVPATLTLSPGGSASVTVSAAATGGFSGPISVVTQLAGGLTADVPSFTLQPGQSRVVTLSAPAGAAAGTNNATFSGTAPGVTGVRTATVAVDGRLAARLHPRGPALGDQPSGRRERAGDRQARSDQQLELARRRDGHGLGGHLRRAAVVQPRARSAKAGRDPGGREHAPRRCDAHLSGPRIERSGRRDGHAHRERPGVGRATVGLQRPCHAPAGARKRRPEDRSDARPRAARRLRWKRGDHVLDAPPGSTFSPPTLVLAPNAPQPMTLSVPRSTPAGSYVVVLRADEVVTPSARARRPLAISKTIRVPLDVQPPVGGFTVTASPVAVQASPGQVVAITYVFRNLGSDPLRIVGDTFTRSAGTTVFDSVGETVDLVLPPDGSLTYTNAVQATGDMFAQAGQPPLVRADRAFRAAPDATGFVDTASASVAITAVNPLLATASATRISVVFPIAGSLVARGESLRAQGLIFTTRSGLFLVGWYCDGILVETASVPVQNGTPVAVSNAVTLPTLIAGTHEITLAVLTPNPIASPPVQIYVDDVGSSLRTVSPASGSAFVPALQAPTFSWVPVPGITAYKVGLGRRGRPEEFAGTTAWGRSGARPPPSGTGCRRASTSGRCGAIPGPAGPSWTR